MWPCGIWPMLLWSCFHNSAAKGQRRPASPWGRGHILKGECALEFLIQWQSSLGDPPEASCQVLGLSCLELATPQPIDGGGPPQPIDGRGSPQSVDSLVGVPEILAVATMAVAAAIPLPCRAITSCHSPPLPGTGP